MKTANVVLGLRSYEIIVGAGLLGSICDHLSKIEGFEKAAVITDSNVHALYGESITKQLESVAAVNRLVVDPGEGSKSWSVAGRVLEDLAKLGLGRHDLIVTLGGGMISDLGGFVASAYLRGIRVVHLPTTLLGQVDAAIGGKTGVNLSAGKNLAGAFYQPSEVVCDVQTLLSLPERELRSGLAEVIKYGLCFDLGILGFFRGTGGSDDAFLTGAAGVETTATAPLTDPSTLEEIVYRCAAIKARVVSTDETDQSERMLLNYGHTFGHALEAAGGFKKWSHGEAIAVGMTFAANLALAMGILDEQAVAVHKRLFEAAGLPVKASFDRREVARLWKMDKKRRASQRWVLLEDLGKPVVRSDAGPPEIETALAAVQE